jgi:hypothetical protein
MHWGWGGGGAIRRLKEHLAGIKGQLAPCMVSLEKIGHIRLELQNLKKTRLGKRRWL